MKVQGVVLLHHAHEFGCATSDSNSYKPQNPGMCLFSMRWMISWMLCGTRSRCSLLSRPGCHVADLKPT